MRRGVPNTTTLFSEKTGFQILLLTCRRNKSELDKDMKLQRRLEMDLHHNSEFGCPGLLKNMVVEDLYAH